VRIAILGPTASGKSALAVAVARRLGGAVVNGDPFQALAGLAIGTGQPFAAEQGGVPHLGYGVLPLSSRPNPPEFGALARGWLADLEAPVLVTGSGLYLRGIWNQLTALPEVPEALVAKVRRLGLDLGAPRLHRYLRAVDPDRATELHPNDGARIQRALALHLATGLRPSALLTGVVPVPAGWHALVVRPTRERQRERIAARVDAQLAEGWGGGGGGRGGAGRGRARAGFRPLGSDPLGEGGVSPGQARDRIVQATQAYAKRQATWFRNQLPEVPGWDPDKETLAAAFAKLEIQ